jgi:hypothetical protein
MGLPERVVTTAGSIRKVDLTIVDGKVIDNVDVVRLFS